MVKIEQLHAEIARCHEAKCEAEKALCAAKIALAEALCPFSVGQTIKVMWRKSVTPAVVKAVLPGTEVYARWISSWKLRVAPIKKDGTPGAEQTSQWWDNDRLLKLNNIVSEEEPDADKP